MNVGNRLMKRETSRPIFVYTQVRLLLYALSTTVIYPLNPKDI